MGSNFDLSPIAGGTSDPNARLFQKMAELETRIMQLERRRSLAILGLGNFSPGNQSLAFTSAGGAIVVILSARARFPSIPVVNYGALWDVTLDTVAIPYTTSQPIVNATTAGYDFAGRTNIYRWTPAAGPHTLTVTVSAGSPSDWLMTYMVMEQPDA